MRSRLAFTKWKYNYSNGAQRYSNVNTLIASLSFFPDLKLVIFVPADVLVSIYFSPSANTMLITKPDVFFWISKILFIRFDIYDGCRDFSEYCVTTSVKYTKQCLGWPAGAVSKKASLLPITTSRANVCFKNSPICCNNHFHSFQECDDPALCWSAGKPIKRIECPSQNTDLPSNL